MFLCAYVDDSRRLPNEDARESLRCFSRSSIMVSNLPVACSFEACSWQMGCISDFGCTSMVQQYALFYYLQTSQSQGACRVLLALMALSHAGVWLLMR